MKPLWNSVLTRPKSATGTLKKKQQKKNDLSGERAGDTCVVCGYLNVFPCAAVFCVAMGLS